MSKVTDYLQGVLSTTTNAVGVWVRRANTTSDDVQGVLIVDMDGSDNVTFSPLAKDGTDATDANATQATAGLGLRGWLSTLVSLFRAGTAKVSIRLLTAADVVTITKTYTPIQTESTTNTRTASGGTNVYQTVTVPIVMPAGFNPTELGLAGTLGPLTFATNGSPAGNVTLNLEHQDASGRWNSIWNAGSLTANAGIGLYPIGNVGSGLSSNQCFTPTLRWNYVFQGTFTNASLTEQMTIWGK